MRHIMTYRAYNCKKKGGGQVKINKKPSGCTYKWKCIYCGKTTRAANEPRGFSVNPECKFEKNGCHKFKKVGN